MNACNAPYRRLVVFWLVASSVWMAFVAWRMLAFWPSLSMDLDPNDHATRQALHAAASAHMSRAAIWGLGAPALALGVGLAVCRVFCNRSKTVSDQTASASRPARILLMRHAEKTGNPDDIHLSASGAARAQQLARYIPATFGQPDFLFAAARSKRSIRSIETLEPLSAAIGKPLQHDIEDRDFASLVAQLFHDPIYRGKTIAICWHHGKLPEIAASLGAETGTFPDPWPEDVFNTILEFSYSSAASPMVRRIVEPF